MSRPCACPRVSNNNGPPRPLVRHLVGCPLGEMQAIMRAPVGPRIRRRILAFLRTGGHPNGPTHNPPGDNWGKRILRLLPQWLWY